jgi:molybdopterin synthase sulfur carrier subunit
MLHDETLCTQAVWPLPPRMAETTAMPPVHLHYWAGAKAAAGTAEETLEASSVRGALELAAAARPGAFSRVLSACSLLIDGVAAHEADLDRPLEGAVRVEVLPPFAGG